MSSSDWDYSLFWEESRNTMKETISEQEYKTWIHNINYVSSNENEVILSVPSAFFKDRIIERYQAAIEKNLFDISGHKIRVSFTVGENQVQSVPDRDETEKPEKSEDPPVKSHRPVQAVKRPPKQHSINKQLNPQYSFENFIIGENNSFAANAAYAIAKNPGRSYNPCLVYGGVGLGKTHLVQAIGNLALQDNDELKVVYVTAESFTNEFIFALRDKKTHLLKNKYRSADILLIDDIHFLQSKIETQEELFHTFNALYDSNKQMVFTCDRPVAELKNLKDRLRNRFERGLNVDLSPPDFETRLAILTKKIEYKRQVEKKSFDVSPEVLELICKNITTNVRDLEAALIKLIAYSDLVSKKITLTIAQQQLRDAFSSPRQSNVTMDIIQRVVADHYNISQGDLKSKKRTKFIVEPRQIAMHIAREITEHSTTEIGLEFGGRDHTTVMHACQRIEKKISSDPSLGPTIQNLIRTIKEQGTKS